MLLQPSIDLRRPQAPAYGEQAVAVGVYGWGGEEFGGVLLASGCGCFDVGFVPLFGRLGAPVKIVFGIEPEAGHLGGLAGLGHDGA